MNLRFFLIGNPFVKNSDAKAKPLSNGEKERDIAIFLKVPSILKDPTDKDDSTESISKRVGGPRKTSGSNFSNSATRFQDEFYSTSDSLELWGARDQVVDRYGY